MNDDLLTSLLERNRQAAAEHPGPLPPLPRLGLLVLTCPDPRLDPLRFLGLDLGDAVVLRFPAGRFTPAVARTLIGLGVVGQRILGEGSIVESPAPPHLMIVHHTDCGITRLDRPEDAPLLASLFEIAPEDVSGRALGDPRSAVALDVAEARAKFGGSGLRVTGHVYDVETGLLETVAG